MNRRGCQLTAAPRQQLAEIPSSFPRYLGTSEGAHGAVVAEVVGRYYAPARPTCAAEELAPLREKAERHGVAILTRPEIEAAIAQSQFEPDPNATLERWRQLSLTRFLTGGRLD